LIGIWRQYHEHRNLPEEDFAGAVAFLREHAGASDLVLVHAASREGFRLYSAMDGWPAPPPVYGDTGWPCCARGKTAGTGCSTAPGPRIGVTWVWMRERSGDVTSGKKDARQGHTWHWRISPSVRWTARPDHSKQERVKMFVDILWISRRRGCSLNELGGLVAAG
jgi:hypothetical protein